MDHLLFSTFCVSVVTPTRTDSQGTYIPLARMSFRPLHTYSTLTHANSMLPNSLEQTACHSQVSDALITLIEKTSLGRGTIRVRADITKERYILYQRLLKNRFVIYDDSWLQKWLPFSSTGMRKVSFKIFIRMMCVRPVRKRLFWKVSIRARLEP